MTGGGLRQKRRLVWSGVVSEVKELFRTNDPVLLSFTQALLSEAGIAHLIADANMSIVEGSIGILPRRMLVDEDQWNHARRILSEAGLDEVTGQTRDAV